jgi:hypothetical protein
MSIILLCRNIRRGWVSIQILFASRSSKVIPAKGRFYFRKSYMVVMFARNILYKPDIAAVERGGIRF